MATVGLVLLGIAGVGYGLFGLAISVFGSIMSVAGKADETSVMVNALLSLAHIGVGIFLFFAAAWGSEWVGIGYWTALATVGIGQGTALVMNSRHGYGRSNSLIGLVVLGASIAVVLYLLLTYAR